MPFVTIQAWKCPRTGQLFENKTLYVQHLKDMAKRNLEERAEEKAAEEKRLRREALNTRATELRNSIYSVEDLVHFLENEGDFIRDYYNEEYGFFGKLTGVKIKIHDLHIRQEREVSNSHHCPIGGTTNWGCRVKNAPTSYPGFSGTIRFKVTHTPKSHNIPFGMTRITERLHLYHSCMNGGDVSFGDIYFFKDDFPHFYEHGHYEYNPKTRISTFSKGLDTRY